MFECIWDKQLYGLFVNKWIFLEVDLLLIQGVYAYSGDTAVNPKYMGLGVNAVSNFY